MPAENGYVPTPAPVANYAAATAFGALRPSEVDGGRLLLPGLGTGRLYDAVRRYCTAGEGWHPCRQWGFELPTCVGVENDPQRVREFRDEHSSADLELLEADFLLDPPSGQFDWVLANPPFVRYKRIPVEARNEYADRFTLVDGQFPLYVPFFEQALRLLRDGGWLTFILPVQALFIEPCKPLRWLLRSRSVGPIMWLPPETFNEAVETILVGLKKEPTRGGDHLWLEHLYEHEARAIIEQLGVGDVDDSVDHYYESAKETEQFLQRRDKLERDERADSETIARQSALAEYTSGGR